MTKLAVLVALLLPATACSKSSHEKACKHMIDLASKEIDKQIAELDRLDKNGSMKSMLVEMRAKAEEQRDSDLETCGKKMSEHDIDASCILDADDLEEAQGCLLKRK